MSGHAAPQPLVSAKTLPVLLPRRVTATQNLRRLLNSAESTWNLESPGRRYLPMCLLNSSLTEITYHACRADNGAAPLPALQATTRSEGHNTWARGTGLVGDPRCVNRGPRGTRWLPPARLPITHGCLARALARAQEESLLQVGEVVETPLGINFSRRCIASHQRA